MKLVILDTLTLGEINLEEFKEFGDVETYETTSQEDLIKRCIDADIIITCKVRFDAQVLRSLPKLKLIALTSTGTDVIDLECAKALGIEVKNVAGYSTQAVAQHTFMLVLALLGNLAYYDRYCKQSHWCSSPVFTHIVEGSYEIQGKEWGIIGLGNIGKQTAKIAEAFGANISYTSISGNNSCATYPHKSLDDLLSSSDIITIHSPLTPQTYHLLNQEKLTLLKENALLVNVGRGGIIDEYALAQRMRETNMKFGSDVLEYEPMKLNHPLLDSALQDRIILTPHSAWAYMETRKRLMQKVYANIKDFIQTLS